MLFVIYSKGVHSLVFLVNADTEEQAWKLYLEHDWDYQEQPDGMFQHKTLIHDDLQNALDTYGLEPQPDGSYAKPDEHFASLQEAQAAFGIEENNGTVTSHDKSYPNMAAALRAVPWQSHRLEIAPADIQPEAPFQVLFTSRDEWDYVEVVPEEDVKADIVAEHIWQAQRYDRLNLLDNAVAELKKALHLSTVASESANLHWNLARIFVKINNLSDAIVQYQQCLQLGMSAGETSMTHFYLAGLSFQLGQREKSLQHYRQVDLQDLDDEESAELTARIAELQQSTGI